KSFPFKTRDVLQILGVSRETLFRWEREGVIPHPHRSMGLQPSRQIGSQEFLEILSGMKGLTRRVRGGVAPRYSWLADFDPQKKGSVTVPSTGYTISLNPSLTKPI
ncbi:MAG: hypothetical protein Q8N98_01445, partial [bacterium]|nr:hypothetical protein [bacterium]